MFGQICIAGLLSCGVVMGQSSVAPKAAEVSQGAAVTMNVKAIPFAVASVRRNKSGVGGGNGVTADGYNVKNVFPVILLSMAYGVSDFQRMQGLPDWCRFGGEGYDINAKVADSDVPAWQKKSATEFRNALRALMEDRFQLKAHFEARDAPAYALVVAKNGPKFKAATPGDTYPNGEHDREGKPALGLSQKDEPGSDHGRLIAQAVPMAALAQYFSGFLRAAVGRPVVDKTGLVGQYDFSMPILAEWVSNHQQENSEASIFTTLQDSLGLKLEPTKLPVEFLVIDHIERPSEN